MFKKINKQSGLIKFIFIIIIGIIVLSYFGFDIKNIIESPRTQENLSYVWGMVSGVWNNYLAAPAKYLWNDIFINLLWSSFVDNMEKLKNNDTTAIVKLISEAIFV